VKNEGANVYKNLSEVAKNNNVINKEWNERFDVKTGLRNKNGSGVLVGLTKVGDVHGFIIDENEKVPVDGRLSYRGIDVNKIVEGFQQEKRFGYEEVCYLLLLGKLPNKEELNDFQKLLGEHRKLPDNFTEDAILTAPSNNIMNKLARSVLALYSYDPNPDDTSLENTIKQCINLVAQFPILVAYAYQAKSHYYNNQSLIIHAPNPEFSTAENILSMIRADMKYTRLEAELLDLALVLHAEHGGGNNSAFTTRLITSSGTDTYSAISAAIGSLKGPKHGGASNKVRAMMEEIKQNVDNWDNDGEVADYLTKILNKEAFDRSGLIYGMGHAVYTLSDPRAELLKKKAYELALEGGFIDEYNLHAKIEALVPEIFAKVKGNDKAICANVDYYSGFVYSMLNIPEELFTPLFAVSRIAGWSAHRMEELLNNNRIMRPAYKSIHKGRVYEKLEDRK